MNPLKRNPVSLVLAVLAAAGLAYDAKVHLNLAETYSHVGSTITQGALFQIEAVVAIVVALALLLSDDWRVWVAAGITGLGGVAAVVLYRYVDVGSIGPIPNMYEPTWFPQKTHSAYAEAGVAVLAIVRVALRVTSRRGGVANAA